MTTRRWIEIGGAALLAGTLALAACRRGEPAAATASAASPAPAALPATRPFTIGHLSSPLLSALYLAEQRPGWREADRLVRFETSADLGYALIAGKVDAAFVEPAKALLIKDIREFKQIDVVGKVTYPYGGILVVRKGLGLKVQDLPGHTVAISADECRLFHTLKKDLAWLKVDTKKIKFVQVPFPEMLPAVEAGVVDAAITKASYGLTARKLGHTVPYVQYDIVSAGDSCCPVATLETEFLLLSRSAARADVERLAHLLLEAQLEKDADLRAATHAKLGIPLELLETAPAARFAYADNVLLKLFLKADEEERAEAAERAEKAAKKAGKGS
jgi:ABC-type nitrate/sulfonate/bicarbonate transport system substrate-binding protein